MASKTRYGNGRLQDSPDKLRSLHEAERTGDEPDVIGAADDGGACLFCDCVAEGPQGRRSLSTTQKL
ncbi:DUF4256 domain-containing protein [Variovorax ginsengisoli]|uniref:DUF4256 domain-containing protein n=1 Tax=Variovorax ginsengisoli TaxID=363844 RepID=UPI0034550ADE